MQKNSILSIFSLALGIGRCYGIVQQCGTCEPLQIPTKWTEKERRLPNAGNCPEEKAKWLPKE